MSEIPEDEKFTIPCKDYFIDRLIFFLDCKYFTSKKYEGEESELLEQSIMRAAVELKAYTQSLELMREKGYTIEIEQREFKPFLKDFGVTDVVESETPSPPSPASPEETEADYDI